MKTTMKQLAAGTFIALLLLVGSVNAKGTEKIASGHESIESTLRVEKWMTNEFLWSSDFTGITGVSTETEAKMEIENWMKNPVIWNPSTDFVQETETSLELENWMTSEATWSVISTESDSDLTLENWMTENNIL